MLPADAERILAVLADLANAADETLELYFPMRGKTMLIRPSAHEDRFIH